MPRRQNLHILLGPLFADPELDRLHFIFSKSLNSQSMSSFFHFRTTTEDAAKQSQVLATNELIQIKDSRI